MNPYVFLVGCPRSGTSLLHRIVKSHPEIAVIFEAQWVPLFWERRVGVTEAGIVTPDLVRQVVEHRRFHRLRVDAGRIAALVPDGEPKHYARFVSEVFDLHGEVKGKRLVGEKTPRYVRHLATLHALWPHAKFVHLIRDGRDVALSLLGWSRAARNVGRFPTWAEDPTTTSALLWDWHVRLGREAAASLGPDLYYELRYESLVAEPEEEAAKLCGFLDVPYDDAMLRFHEGRKASRPGKSRRGSWLPVTAGLRRWSEQMRPADVARVEAAAGPLLDELGYGCMTAAASDEELARVARLREAFAAHARRRGAIPRAWERVPA